MPIYKAGVFGTPSRELSYAISLAEALYASLGKDLVITSLQDGQHQSDSLHYSGNAADFRISNLTSSQAQSIYSSLRAQLYNLGFDVVLEFDHIHAEYQPRGSRRMGSAAAPAPSPGPVVNPIYSGQPSSPFGFLDEIAAQLGINKTVLIGGAVIVFLILGKR
jgi:hypothetical protein